ncbi:hypothetical protein GCM10025855_06570 [Shewanella glacialipiscicola]|uniref:Phosphorelay protein LuxU n=2 Tax=Shewanella glacialipiscicola TaxID=614069 RepID=A0ABQ6J1L2_9GAMM|nr:hypothetical protein GCM10025855_06570 [Shewanella glacialipiscicola]
MDSNGRGIWVKSQPEKGSEFGFTLAFSECDMTHAIGVKESALVPIRRVLVVEDNNVNAMVAQGFLAHLGHESVLAISCQQALELASSSGLNFDAVMLDIQLSDGSGIDLLPQLKSLFATPKVKFAAFTAQMQSEDLQLYHKVGFDTVLAKPLSLQTLIEWLGVAVALSPSAALTVPSAANNAQASVLAPMALASTAQAIDDGPLLDLTQLEQDKEVLGVNALIAMFELFSDSSAEQIASLSPAATNCDAAKLLHALKGSSASMGLIALAQLAKRLEVVPKSSADNVLELTQYQQLESCWRASIAALQQWLEPQS